MLNTREHCNKLAASHGIQLENRPGRAGDFVTAVSQAGQVLYESLYERDMHVWLSGFGMGRETRVDIVGSVGVGQAKTIDVPAVLEETIDLPTIIREVNETFGVQAAAIRTLDEALGKLGSVDTIRAFVRDVVREELAAAFRRPPQDG